MISLPDTLPDTTRVWIYPANRPFSEEEIPTLRQQLQEFVIQWVSHNRQLRSYADVWHRRFIVLMVDESQAGASGCSIDASVRFLKSLQAKYGVDLFDRMIFSYLDGDTVKSVPREEFARLYAAGEINDDTPVFDNLVNTKRDLQSAWVKPLAASWHKRMV